MQFTYDSPSACQCPHGKESKIFLGFKVCINTGECNNCVYFVSKDIMAKTIECSFKKESCTKTKLELFLSGEIGLRSSYQDNTDKIVEFLNENNVKFSFEGLYGTKSNYITFISRDKIDGFKRATTCSEQYWLSHFDMENRQVFNIKEFFPRYKIKTIFLGI